MIKQWFSSKQSKMSSILLTIGILGISVLLISFARSYFSVPIFYVNDYKYKQVSDSSDRIVYQSRRGPSIQVEASGNNKTVIIDNEEYLINRIENMSGTLFYVSYPNGNEYKVVGNSNRLATYEKKGELVWPSSLYYNNQRVLNDGEELYYPGSIVQAAYPEYHKKQGTPFFYGLSIFVLIYGWCGYRYEKFQNFMFILSLKWIWTNDHEPSDFYYFMCKVGGILTMIASLPLFFKSL